MKITWIKKCGCKGFSKPAYCDDGYKLTGDKLTLNSHNIYPPVCEKCNRVWEVQNPRLSTCSTGDAEGLEGGSKNSGWISVKDKLPEIDKYYIIYRPGYNQEIAIQVWWEGDSYDQSITHWMPLPEKPVG